MWCVLTVGFVNKRVSGLYRNQAGIPSRPLPRIPPPQPDSQRHAGPQRSLNRQLGTIESFQRTVRRLIRTTCGSVCCVQVPSSPPPLPPADVDSALRLPGGLFPRSPPVDHTFLCVRGRGEVRWICSARLLCVCVCIMLFIVLLVSGHVDLRG